MAEDSASLRVFRADTGGSYQVTVAPSATVDHLRTALSGPSGIAPSDQILICDGSKMEPSKPLSSYDPSLASAGDSPDPRPTSIFLFSRSDLDPSAGPPPPTVLLPGPIVNLPSDPASDLAPPPLPSDAPPLLKAAAEFERALALALTQARAWSDTAAARNTAARACVAEQYVMVKALGAATTNLDGFNRQIGQAVDKSDAYFSSQAARHASLLDGFEASMERLATTAVLPDLATLSPPPHLPADAASDAPVMLAAWVPEERLRKWASDCKTAHESLQTKLKDLTASVESVKSSVEEQMNRSSPLDDMVLDEALAASAAAVSTAAMDKDVVADLYQAVAAVVRNGVVKAEDIAQMESTRAQAVDEVLVRMAAADAALYADVQSVVAAAKDAVAAEVSSRLHDVSTAQSRISDLGNRISLYTEAMSKQQVAFGQLVHVARMPDAYRAAVAEVVRRRAFGRMYRSQGDNIAEAMAKVAAEEHAKRERFQRKYGKYLPSSLVPGLGDRPPQAEVRVPPDFDTALPDLDLSDVESSAGESLFVGSAGSMSTTAPSFLLGSMAVPTGSTASSTPAAAAGDVGSASVAVAAAASAANAAALHEAQSANKELESRIKSLEEALAASAAKLREQSQEQSVLPTSPSSGAAAAASAAELEEALEAKTKAAAQAAAQADEATAAKTKLKEALEAKTKAVAQADEAAAAKAKLEEELEEQSKAAAEAAAEAAAAKAEAESALETKSKDAAEYAANNAHLEVVLADMKNEAAASQAALESARDALALVASLIDPDSETPSSSDSIVPEDHADLIAALKARLQQSTAANAESATSAVSPSASTITSTSSASSSGQTPLLHPRTPLTSPSRRPPGLPDGISYSSFADGGLALFFPTKGGAYIAFNVSAPHHYLAEESLEAFLKTDKSRPSYVLGVIVHIATEVSAGDKGGDKDPFKLGPGVEYHVVTVSKVF